MSEQKQEPVVLDEQLNKALNDLDVLNAQEKEVYRIDSERFLFSNVEYKLIENHKDAFDLELMESRYTDYLLKYDYIVGDMSYQKLRLRGFYEDYRKGIPIDMKISNLEDYLVEYCSFGCQYFVFERVDKVDGNPDPYFKQKKSKRSNQRRQNKQKQNRNSRRNKNQPQKSSRTQKPEQNKKQASSKGRPKFQVTKVEKQEQTLKETKGKESTQTTKNDQRKDNKPFKIRKKKD